VLRVPKAESQFKTPNSISFAHNNLGTCDSLQTYFFPRLPKTTMKPPNKNATKIMDIPGAVNEMLTLSPFRVGIIPKTNRITPTIPPNNAIKEGAASIGFSKRVQLIIFEEFIFPDFLKQISWSQLYIFIQSFTLNSMHERVSVKTPVLQFAST